MDVKDLNVTLSLKTGHLIRQLEVIQEGISDIKLKLSRIPYDYCEIDGEVLMLVEQHPTHNVMQCSKCCEKYVFQRNR